MLHRSMHTWTPRIAEVSRRLRSRADAILGAVWFMPQDGLPALAARAACMGRVPGRVAAALFAPQHPERVAAAVDEAVGPLNARIVELEGQLDTSTIEARTATDQLTELKAWLDGQAAEAAQAAEVAGRREARVTAAREALPVLTDDDVEARAERWAAMDDDAFAAHLDELKAVAARFGGAAPGSNRPPAKTAMTAAAGERGGAGTAGQGLGLGQLLSAARTGSIDLSQL